MSRANVREVARNPAGFSERLRLLMEGWGYSTRDVADKTDVSHTTVDNWLNDRTQAGPDQVDAVARLFGWTGGQLYSGETPAGIMNRVAELDGFRARARRVARDIANDFKEQEIRSEDRKRLVTPREGGG